MSAATRFFVAAEIDPQAGQESAPSTHCHAAGGADSIASMTDSVLHYVHDEDTVAAVESCVVDGSSSDGSAHIAIDRADVDIRVASADLSADRLVSDRIVGSAPGKHDAELRGRTVSGGPPQPVFRGRLGEP